ncbi:TdeIII family type II restriction endonuclease [Treponema sp. OMZ 305]|uniref:TdeIII family type II restriction endonuclease n=1 Tax=Treponema sp. OMZ 305 TaxID=1659192 RepID=UPI0020A38471
MKWVAVTLAEHPTAHIHTLLAIPYNPYEPKEYGRWTMRGMIDSCGGFNTRRSGNALRRNKGY